MGGNSSFLSGSRPISQMRLGAVGAVTRFAYVMFRGRCCQLPGNCKHSLRQSSKQLWIPDISDADAPILHVVESGGYQELDTEVLGHGIIVS
jgi:hypothetical protein